MLKNNLDLTLYLVTDRLVANLSFEQLIIKVEQACRGGVSLVQLREKDATFQEYVDMAKQMMQVTHKYNVPLIVDDRVDVALVAETDGVHIGLDDMSVADARRILGKNKIIGSTAKTIERAQLSEQEGADYLGTGAIFQPIYKVKTHRTDIKTLDEIASSVYIPTVAISGINRSNISKLEKSPIAGIAIEITCLLNADDTEIEAKLLRNDVITKIINYDKKVRKLHVIFKRTKRTGRKDMGSGI